MKNCTPGNCGLDNPMSEFNLMGRMLTVLASEAVCVHTYICVYACIYICVCVCMSMYRCFENIQDLKMPVTLPIGLKNDENKIFSNWACHLSPFPWKFTAGEDSDAFAPKCLSTDKLKVLLLLLLLMDQGLLPGHS